LLREYLQAGGSIIDISQMENFDIFQASIVPGVVVLDGILGTGVKLPIRGGLHSVMEKIKQIVENQAEAVVVAIDCPSGVDCDTGDVSDVTFKADVTLTLAAIKQGLLRHPGRSMAGKFELMDIGLKDISDYLPDHNLEMLDRSDAFRHFPERPDDGHKGTFGTCMVLAGSQQYTGAAYLVGKAAYFSGCGLVHVATHEKVQKSLSGQLIEGVWTILPEVDGAYDWTGIELISKEIGKVDSIVIGPGWGLCKDNISFLDGLLNILPKDLPTVIDADGLKLLKQIKGWWKRLPSNSVLTPHPGEMSVLTGLKTSEIQKNRWDIAKIYAEEWQVVLLLKGAVSVISTPSSHLFVSPISDSALATAGSGDVLSGVIGGLLAQGLPLINAVTLGTWIHGQAGVIAHEKLGTSISVTATDILSSLGNAFDKNK
jgi:NAD(P)H-hydrate epimerase